MRPRTLTFSGLRSYRTTATVDFDDLDLFAVIGDTGAGKSTMIEALCFALYARKTWTGGAKHDLIADGADVLIVELVFDADGHTWKVTRSRRRSGSSPVDKLESIDGHTSTVDGAREVNDRVEELLGLDFEQFTRAVVMPQGRFDELLRATESERNRTLKSILGLGDVTAVASAAATLRGKVRDARTRFEERRKNLPDNPAAVLAAAEEALKSAQARHAELAAAVESIESPRKLRDNTAGPLRALTTAVNAVDTIDDPADILDTCHRRGVDLLTEYDNAAAAIATETDAITGIDTAIADKLAGFAHRDALYATAGRVEIAADELPDALAELKRATEAREDLDEQAPKAEVDEAIRSRVESARSLADDKRNALERAKGLRVEARRSMSQLLDARARLTVLEREATEAHRKLDEAIEARESCDTAVADAEDKVTAAAEAQQIAKWADAVAAIAAGHGPGDECPVCTRPLPATFEPPSTEDLDATAEELTDAKSELDKLRKQAQTQIEKVASSGAAAKSADRAVAEATTDIGGLEAGVVNTSADPDATTVDDAVADLEAQMSEASAQADAAADEHSKANETLQQAVGALEQARAGFAARVEDADAAVERAKRAVAERTTGLATQLPAQWAATGTITVADLEDLAKRCRTALTTIDGLVKERANAEARIGSATDTQTRVRTDTAEQVTHPATQAITSINMHLGRVRDVAARIADAAAAAGIEAPAAGNLDEITVAVKPDDLAATAATVRHRLTESVAVVTAADQITNEIRSVLIEAEAAISDVLTKTDCESVDDLLRALGQAGTAVTTAEQNMATAKEQLESATTIDAILDVVVPFCDNLEVLTYALRDNQFVDHLLSLREAELLAEATRRLKVISGNRFGFVEDFGVKNIASGEIRSPDALSGGERFQASLSLALALVEIASRGAGRLDAVFVDEGFGSLDANALDMALETLGKVAGDGKMVALISHLRHVAEYVDTVMHVTRDDAAGSRIRQLSIAERDALLADDIRSGLTG